MKVAEINKEELESLLAECKEQYKALQEKSLNLDLTRGKPSTAQVQLSDELDGILGGNYKTDGGVDTRNYGGIDGIPELKKIFAPILGVEADEVVIGGNSSLTLMFQYMNFAQFFGAGGAGTAWSAEGKVKFICPVPGYDRHYTVCESLGIDMITVPMDENGPDMDAVTELVKNDSSIKGIWCVPKYSNPTGATYSSEVVNKLAELPKVAGANFRIMWDNAYAVHDLDEDVPVDCLLEKAKAAGTADSVVMFGSTSKVSFAGAGIAFLSSTASNLDHFKKHISVITIGPDKVNQLRHVKFFKDYDGLKAHMKKHADVVRPKFKAVLDKLEQLDGLGFGSWTNPKGGYFVSFDSLDGLASKIISLCGDAGVKLTPAGSTFPYKKDPNDKNIRLAPTFPEVADIETAMDVFICAVKLASAEKLLAE